MNWLLRIRDWVEGNHTPSYEEHTHTGQRCPCGELATAVLQIQLGNKSGTYYTCGAHTRVTRWIPNPEDTGKWF